MKVAIIGGGIIGCSVAHYLKMFDESVDVTVFEMHEVAGQSSGKAGGYLCESPGSSPFYRLPDVSDFSMTMLAFRNFWYYKELTDELQTDIGFRNLPTYQVKMDFTKDPGGAGESPEPLGWLREVEEPPEKDCEEDESAQVDPKLVTKAFLDCAMKKGAKVVIGEVVDVLVDEADNVKSLKLKNGDVHEADVVVVANGPWVVNSGSWFPKASHLFKFFHLRGHSLVFEAELPPQATYMAYKAKHLEDGFMVIYPRPDGTTYCSGFYDFTELPEDPRCVRPNDNSVLDLKAHASLASEALSGEAIKESGAAFLPISHDLRPVIGDIPGYQGAFIAAGHGWWGVLFAPLTGLSIAALILDKEQIIGIDSFSLDRFENES